MSPFWMNWRARAAIATCCIFGAACGSDDDSNSGRGPLGGGATAGSGAAPATGGATTGTGGAIFVPTGGTGNVQTGGTGNVQTGGTGTGGTALTGGFGGANAGATDDAGTVDASTDASAGGMGGEGDSGGPGGTSGTGGLGTGGSGTGGNGTGGGGGSSCTGRPGSLQGYSSQSITVGLTQRTFIYYAPPSLDPNQPAPLVIVPHGFTMSGQIMYDITGYKAVADREGFVAVFPDGTAGNPWNCGAGICGAGALVNGTGNDQAFMDALIEFVDDDQCLDRDHVFMSGFSMGGYFSNESGCLRSDIAGIGPHSGGSHDLTSCPGSIKPVILFHFDNDSLISYTCGAEARDRWVQRNGCSLASPDVRKVLNGSCEYYKGCDAGGQVALCTFTGGLGPLFVGHGWAGGVAGGYSVVDAENAAELGWAFFKEFAW